ncbi:MAG TPA: hypothetical protein VFT70_14345, partial [Nocardioides sp.]|nr:hypothetical protein [Nocardioides sp.]
MNSSGMKRGLAVSAISALAVAGLPLLTGTAHAEPISNNYAAGSVDLATGEVALGGRWDPSPDGQDSRVHLVAAAGATVQEVQFEWTSDGVTWHNIDRVAVASGIAQVFWDTTGVPVGNVTVRATGWDANNNMLGQESNTQNLNPSGVSVDIGNATGSALGLFTQPYAGPNNNILGAISGTTSGNTVQTSAPNYGGNTGAIMGDPDANGIRSYTGTIVANGYSFAGDPDQLLVRAQSNFGLLGSDDADAVAPYAQTISSVDIAANPASVPTPPGGNSNITITVKDQNGKPVVGAQVSSPSANDEATGVPNGTASDHVAGYTNALGQITVARPANSAPGNDYYYWVNTTGNTSYQDGTDYRVHVHVGSYTPAPTALTVSSNDGDAFDLDEWTNSDVTVKVVDQNGNPMNGQTVRYTWKFTPFNPSATNTAWSTTEATSTTNAQGVASINRPTNPGGNAGTEGTYTLMAYVNTNGTPGFQAGEPTVTKDLKAGQAAPQWTDGTRKQFLAGTATAVLEGKLVLDDGTVLANRFVSMVYTHGTDETGTNTAKMAPQASQPAGTNRISDTEASAKTDANGVFRVALTDPAATPQGKELGGDLDAFFGPTGGTVEHDHITVDFLRSLAPAAINYVSETPWIDGVASPGRPVTVKYVVKNAQGDILSDIPVDLTTDHGFFSPLTNGALTPDPAPANGADYGEWKSGGATTTQSSSDADGTVSVVVAIERDAGFDDDGEVAAAVQAKSGSVTGNHEVKFSTDYTGGGASNEPLNPGAVKISLAPVQESTVLPSARIDQAVGYRVEATDSFGNLVADEASVNDDTANAGVGGDHNGATAEGVVTQFTKDTGAVVEARSWTPGTNQSVTATYTAGTRVYYDDPSTVATDLTVNSSGEKTLTNTAAAINWYTVDWADPATVLEIGSDESGTVPVGTAVHTEVKAIDQKGQPIDDLDVKFVRKGPNPQVGDENWNSVTNDHG